MNVLYAYFRLSDDLVDGPGTAEDKATALADWRREVESALAGGSPSSDYLPALADVVERFQVEPAWLLELLDGMAQDLDHQPFATWADLERYCYRVAVTVGLASIRVWGCRDPRATEPARAAGYAFQLTNILRDLRADAAGGRIYLPRELWEPLGAQPADLTSDRWPLPWLEAARLAAARAESYFAQAAPLEALLPLRSKGIWQAMLGTYRALLSDLRQRDFAPGAGQLGWLQRWSIVVRAVAQRWSRS